MVGPMTVVAAASAIVAIAATVVWAAIVGIEATVAATTIGGARPERGVRWMRRASVAAVALQRARQWPGR